MSSPFQRAPSRSPQPQAFIRALCSGFGALQPATTSAAVTSLFLIATLLLAGLLRFYGIARESLWLDEATSLMLARMDVPTLIAWTALDIHPPLYYTLLHVWITLGSSEVAIRSLSTLAGLLTVWVTYGLGRTLSGRRSGLLAALLLAVSPVHVWYSQEARMYAWVTLLMATSLLLALRAWRDGGRPTARWAAWIAYVLVTAAALYTHYYAVFIIGIENLAIVYLLVARRLSLRRPADRRLFWRWVAAELAVFLLFLPWFPTFLLPITVGGGGWITAGLGRPSVAVLAQTAVLYMVGFGRELYPALVRRLGYLIIVGVFAVGVWPHAANSGTDKEPLTPLPLEALGLTVSYLVLPIALAWGASQVFKPMYSARYMLPFVVPFVLLLARGLDRLPRGLWQIATVALVLVGLVGVQAQATSLEKPDWRGLAQSLRERSQPGDLVLFMPGWHAKPFDYYAQGALALYSDVPIPVPRYGDDALAAVDAALVGHDRVWFVWETEHYTDPDGAVFGHLFQHCRLAESAPLDLVGQVMLFEGCDARKAGP